MGSEMCIRDRPTTFQPPLTTHPPMHYNIAPCSVGGGGGWRRRRAPSASSLARALAARAPSASSMAQALRARALASVATTTGAPSPSYREQQLGLFCERAARRDAHHLVRRVQRRRLGELRVQAALELDLGEHLGDLCCSVLLPVGAPICSGRSGCGGGIATTHVRPHAIALCQHPEPQASRHDDFMTIGRLYYIAPGRFLLLSLNREGLVQPCHQYNRGYRSAIWLELRRLPQILVLFRWRRVRQK